MYHDTVFKANQGSFVIILKTLYSFTHKYYGTLTFFNEILFLFFVSQVGRLKVKLGNLSNIELGIIS